MGFCISGRQQLEVAIGWGHRARYAQRADGTPDSTRPAPLGRRAGLFATAYGNVGSSIYYALGLVAAHALGLTPLVFMFAGGLFVLTAKTYAEGAAMFPEAGGSSSFARHAFNDVVSFFAGWALSLDYIITIAISAFFVPHYLGAFFPACTHNPGDIIGGIVTIALLAGAEHPRARRVGEAQLFLAVADLCTQVCSWRRHRARAEPVAAGQPGPPRHGRAELDATDLRAVGRDGRLHGDRDGLEHGRGGQGPRPRRAQGVNLVLIAVLGVYAGISVVALSALPVIHHGVGYSAPSGNRLRTPATPTALGGHFENDPVLGIVSRLGLHGTVLTIAEDYVGVLAATILFIATNAGLIGISRLSWSLAEHRQLPEIFSQPAPEVPHAVVHDRLLLGPRRPADPPGRNDAAGQPLLLRRDAVVHDRPRLGGRAADQAARPRAPLPDALERPLIRGRRSR
jgi:APA family basic amino acid/polyamine antiporter